MPRLAVGGAEAEAASVRRSVCVGQGDALALGQGGTERLPEAVGVLEELAEMVRVCAAEKESLAVARAVSDSLKKLGNALEENVWLVAPLTVALGVAPSNSEVEGAAEAVREAVEDELGVTLATARREKEVRVLGVAMGGAVWDSDTEEDAQEEGVSLAGALALRRLLWDQDAEGRSMLVTAVREALVWELKVAPADTCPVQELEAVAEAWAEGVARARALALPVRLGVRVEGVLEADEQALAVLVNRRDAVPRTTGLSEPLELVLGAALKDSDREALLETEKHCEEVILTAALLLPELLRDRAAVGETSAEARELEVLQEDSVPPPDAEAPLEALAKELLEAQVDTDRVGVVEAERQRDGVSLQGALAVLEWLGEEDREPEPLGVVKALVDSACEGTPEPVASVRRDALEDKIGEALVDTDEDCSAVEDAQRLGLTLAEALLRPDRLRIGDGESDAVADSQALAALESDRVGERDAEYDAPGEALVHGEARPDNDGDALVDRTAL